MSPPPFPMSNVQTFQIFGILGEKKWKEVVSYWKTFAHIWCKIAAGKKKFFFNVIFFLQLFTPFKRLYASTSKSPMSKLYRFLKSLGKSNRKRWSQIQQLFLVNGVKLLRKKMQFWGEFCLTSRIIWYQCQSPHRSGDALSPVCGIIFCKKGNVCNLNVRYVNRTNRFGACMLD